MVIFLVYFQQGIHDNFIFNFTVIGDVFYIKIKRVNPITDRLNGRRKKYHVQGLKKLLLLMNSHN